MLYQVDETFLNYATAAAAATATTLLSGVQSTGYKKHCWIKQIKVAVVATLKVFSLQQN